MVFGPEVGMWAAGGTRGSPPGQGPEGQDSSQGSRRPSGSSTGVMLPEPGEGRPGWVGKGGPGVTWVAQ